MTFAGGGSEGSAPAGPSGEGEDAPGNEAQGQAPAGDSRSRAVRQRLTDDRRREILLRLVTDRRARRSPGSSAGGERPSAHNMSREERQERVQHLLAERERSLSYEYDGALGARDMRSPRPSLCLWAGTVFVGRGRGGTGQALAGLSCCVLCPARGCRRCCEPGATRGR